VARPGDGTSDGRQVTYNWWLLLVSLVVVLDLLDFRSVGLEERLVLLLKVLSQGTSVEDSLELTEESEGVDDVGLGIKVVVDVVLEHGVDIGDIDVEFDEITVKAIFVVGQKLVV
jgi:hypothetical protein